VGGDHRAVVDRVVELERGRSACWAEAWTEAYESLSAADRSVPLGPEDLELLATSAYMLGREDEYLATLERAHRGYLDANDHGRSVRAAFWIGIQFAQRGETARASGWLGRAARLVHSHPDEVERGYLLLPAVFEREARGEFDEAARIAGDAVVIAERLGELDLFALAAHMQGHMLIEAGHLRDGLVLLDEAMVPAGAGELSPIVTGIVYCGVILACQLAQQVRRAREWTTVLSSWCDRQPDLVAFTGRCRVHRAEIMQLGGSWAEALVEARRAHGRCLLGRNEAAAGEAAYREGEIYRLTGVHEAAERAFEEASRRGREPQPGLALLRVAQGRRAAALGSIQRAVLEADPPVERVALLPACIEIMLAGGRLEDARVALADFAGAIDIRECPAHAAQLAQAQGAIALASGDPSAALPALRRAARAWQKLDAPYDVARARELVGLACRAVGDEEGACLELGAARLTFTELGAATDVARLDALGRDRRARRAHGLTARELEVLRMLAAGRTNKAIATELVLSARTVDRHVSNIFAKLGVSSRAAATTYAHEHELV
jgi:DNA-binding CsgD family transcriptional regulator